MVFDCDLSRSRSHLIVAAALRAYHYVSILLSHTAGSSTHRHGGLFPIEGGHSIMEVS